MIPMCTGHEAVSLEDRLIEIIEGMRDMEARLRAEMAITEITAAGTASTPDLVAALRRRAAAYMEPRSMVLLETGIQTQYQHIKDSDIRIRTARELHAAATRIEQEAGTTS